MKLDPWRTVCAKLPRQMRSEARQRGICTLTSRILPQDIPRHDAHHRTTQLPPTFAQFLNVEGSNIPSIQDTIRQTPSDDHPSRNAVRSELLGNTRVSRDSLET